MLHKHLLPTPRHGLVLLPLLLNKSVVARVGPALLLVALPLLSDEVNQLLFQGLDLGLLLLDGAHSNPFTENWSRNPLLMIMESVAPPAPAT